MQQKNNKHAHSDGGTTRQQINNYTEKEEK